MKKKYFPLFIVLISVLALGGILQADAVRLKNGSVIKGKILKENSEKVFVDLGYTVLPIPRKEIVGIEKEKPKVEKPDDKKTKPKEERTKAIYSEALLKESDIKTLTEKYGEAIVVVSCPGVKLGAGFIISEDGYVVTNHHVISGERKITVTVFKKEKKEFIKKKIKKVKIIALNAYADLALLKIEKEELEKLKFKLTKVYLGNIDETKAGEKVFAIGNPLGLERSVSEGIVSTRNRPFKGMVYIQTTAPINPGNSGGALFNMKGEVVGVTNMKAGWFTEGLGFAIPVNYVKHFLKNRDAFAFNKDNPNSGYEYFEPPKKKKKEDKNKEKKGKKEK